MADDRQHPPDPTGSAGRPSDRGEDLDQTSEFDPFAEEEDGPARPDRESDETTPLPGVDGTTSLPGDRAVWSGRASVPSPYPPAVPDTTPTEWGEAEEHAGRHWWMPILLGVVALLLLGVLTYGVWLILQSGQEEPGPLPPAPSTATPTSPASRPPSVEPTGTRPTPSGTSAAATVEMPALVGQPEATARAALDRLGLAYRVELRGSGRAPGTVIGTDPDAGTPVPPGTRVTLVIARAPTTPSATASPTTPAPTTSPR